MRNAPFIFLALIVASISSQNSFAADAQYYHTSGVKKYSLLEDKPVPVYHPDPNDAWNEIYHLLYSNTYNTSTSVYYSEDQEDAEVNDLGERPDDLDEAFRNLNKYLDTFHGPTGETERIEGGDLPGTFFADYVGFLLEQPRYAETVRALKKELASGKPEDRSVLARVLFQHDLWNRFDGLYDFIHSESTYLYGPFPSELEHKERAQDLLDLVGRLIAKVACTKEEIRSLSSNYGPAARVYDQLDPKLFAEDSAWRELVADNEYHKTTQHAQNAEYRKTFRIFLHIPEESGGVKCLEEFFGNLQFEFMQAEELKTDSCPGHKEYYFFPESQALLVSYLAVVAQNGEIVPTPIIAEIQSRKMRDLKPLPEGRRYYEIDDLPPFKVFHTSRLELLSSDPKNGGMELFEDDDPVPMFFSLSIFHNQPIAPVKLTCRVCHSPTGSILGTTSIHGNQRVRALHPNNSIQAGRSLKAKQASEDYEMLKGFFGGKKNNYGQIK